MSRPTQQLETTESGTVVRRHRTEVNVYELTGERLDTLTSVDHATWLGAASMCLGASISLTGTFISGYSNASTFMNNAVAGTAAATFILAAVFGVVAGINLWRHHKAVSEFKEGSQNKVQTDPYGDEAASVD